MHTKMKIFKFFWAIGWMLFGVAVALHWQFEGAILGVFALISLVIADVVLSVVKALRDKFGGQH